MGTGHIPGTTGAACLADAVAGLVLPGGFGGHPVVVVGGVGAGGGGGGGGVGGVGGGLDGGDELDVELGDLGEEDDA